MYWNPHILYIQHNSELLRTKWLISLSLPHQIEPTMSSVLTHIPPLKGKTDKQLKVINEQENWTLYDSLVCWHRKQQNQQKTNCIYSVVIKVDRFRWGCQTDSLTTILQTAMSKGKKQDKHVTLRRGNMKTSENNFQIISNKMLLKS